LQLNISYIIPTRSELPASALPARIYALVCCLIDSHYSQNRQCRPSESQMCELVGQVTSAKSDAEINRTAVATQQFIPSDVYGCLHQGLLPTKQRTTCLQPKLGELAKRVRLIAPTLEETQLTFATILHACASHDRGYEKKTDRALYYVIVTRVRVTILSWKRNKYYIFWVCVCSLSYPACNARWPYHIVSSVPCPALQYFSALFPKGHDFWKQKSMKYLPFYENFSEI
jgi:hypothetical protein